MFVKCTVVSVLGPHTMRYTVCCCCLLLDVSEHQAKAQNETPRFTVCDHQTLSDKNKFEQVQVTNSDESDKLWSHKA